MWTHKRPFTKPNLKLETIEGQGHTYLYRSLNIKRVIGIIGSGLSISYGLPGWQALVNCVLAETDKIFEINTENEQEKIDERAQYGIPELGDQSTGEEILSVLEACRQAVMDENRAAGHPEKNIIREAIATHIEEKTPEEFNPNTELDPIHAIFEDLAIRRFLTLNYDLLIERYFHDRHGFASPDSKHDGFTALFDENEDKEEEAPAHRQTSLCLKAETRSGLTATSICMADETIGDLILFSSFPFSHEAQIFHLHGRVDHPESLILTETHYQQLYVGSDNRRRTFNEALDMLFSGNDILFIGIGMNEEDPLRPLRHFTLQERDRIWSIRRVFALLPFETKAKAHRDAIKLKTRYNVHALFYRHYDEQKKDENLLEQEDKTVITRSLVKKIRDLADGNRTWWQEWQEVPEDRIPIYRDFSRLKLKKCDNTLSEQYFSLKQASKNQPGLIPVWSRHRTLFRQNKKKSPVFKKVRKLAKTLSDGKTANNSRRILRLCAPRGYGKGALHLELQDPKRFRTIFAQQGDTNGITYGGAFFAHASFSVEFPSVIEALYRFLAFQIRKLEGNTDENAWKAAKNPAKIVREWKGQRTPHRLIKLKELVRIYTLKARKKTTSHRLFLCFTGLDILVNKYGDGFSPCNRKFFRILNQDTVTDNEGQECEPPFDIVLISGRPEIPIRYLSEKKDDKKHHSSPQQGQKDERIWVDTAKSRPRFTPKSRPKSINIDTGIKAPPLKKWAALPRLAFKERYWLKDTPPHRNIQNFRSTCPVLFKVLEQSVALDSWVSYCALEMEKKCEFETEMIEEWFCHLEHSAGRTGTKEVLGEVFKQYRRNNETLMDAKDTQDLRLIIMRHLALYRIPVTQEVLYSGKNIKDELERLSENKNGRENKNVRKSLLKAALDLLVDRGLIIPVAPPVSTIGPSGEDESAKNVQDEQKRYILHGQMREFVARLMKLSIIDQGERNYFTISIYPNQPHDLPTPNEAHFQYVNELIHTHLENCRDNLSLFYRYNASKTKPDTELDAETKTKMDNFTDTRVLLSIPQQIRAVYSIIRETFSVATLSRLDDLNTSDWEIGQPFEIYRLWLGALIHAATGISEVKNFLDENPAHNITKAYKNDKFELPQSFYHFEIIWLLNERAVTEMVQGHLYDAYAVLNHALRLARSYRSTYEMADFCETTERRILLNKAIILIERARLDKAREILEALVIREQNQPNRTPSTTHVLAHGYLGLCSHLSGHFKDAKKRYKNVIHYCSETGNLRATSIFRRHLADLLRASGQIKAAREQLQLSILAASHDEQKDVLYLALIAQARLERTDSDGNNHEAVRILDTAMTYGRKMGIAKIQVEALKVRAEINMIQGETEFAGRLASQAIGLANRHGMGLRECSSLLLYGQILAERGQTELARKTIRRTLQELEKYHYQHKARQAQDFLRQGQ